MASPLARKLLIKPGTRVGVVDVPPGYRELLEPLPEHVELASGLDSDPDIALIFVQDLAALRAIAEPAFQPRTPERTTWVCYRKGGQGAGTDLNRDILREAVGALGWNAVTLVAIDGIWSAMRFRPAV